MKKKNEKGFTLVELIVVIAIIGTLAAILVPTIYKYIKDARIAAAIADTRTIKSAVEASLVKNIMLNGETAEDGFNKILYLDSHKQTFEYVGCFTNVSWYNYRKNLNTSSKSAKLDKTIATALENSVSETWKTGSKSSNTLSYGAPTKNCRDFLKNNDINFGLVVVYNTDGTVRMMQLFRKGILVTYIDGDYIANTDKKAHFINTAAWSTVYTDVGQTAPQMYYGISLSNKQIGDNGGETGWY